MRQVLASVISNENILGELERTHTRTISGSLLIWLRCPEIAQEARPGQFVMVGCGEECMLPRPFSIHRVNGNSDIAIFFAVWEDGKGTRWLSQCQPGDKVEMFGKALGTSFNIKPKSNRLLLVAGGIGIAPLWFLAEQGSKQGHDVTLFLGASGAYKPTEEENPPQLYPAERLPQGIEVKTITTTPDGKEKMATDLLLKYPQYVKRADQVFACGPTAMYRDMANRKKELGLTGKSVQISLEMRMGCGRGVCYGCTVKTKRGLKQVCQDGPVFELNDIIWDELSPKL